MPLFEFVCKKCGNKFEKMFFSIDNEEIKCPECQSVDVEKQFSTFSAGKAHVHSHGCCSSHGAASCSGNKMSGGCGGCCGM